MLMAGLAYYILEQTLVAHAHSGHNAKLAAAVGRDSKGRLSMVLYLVAIPLAFVNQWVADAIYVTVLVMWLLPDRRIETTLQHPRDPGSPPAYHPTR